MQDLKTQCLRSKGYNSVKINLINIKKTTGKFSLYPLYIYKVWKESTKNYETDWLH